MWMQVVEWKKKSLSASGTLQGFYNPKTPFPSYVSFASASRHPR
jgi:hypothetical protein